MSVCRKLPDGTVQKIAGHTVLLDANASEVREGNVSIPSIPDSAANAVTVTFSDPMPDTNYAVDISFNGNLKPIPQFSIENKTTTGFTIYLIRPITTATPAMTAHYTAWKPVKIEGYTALQNKVENPDSTPTIDSMNLVTSDGVARAIENASAVWKGTKAAWEALPSADKLKYDLAVLLDETLVKAVDRTDGTETDVANLNKIFRGTEAEWQALSAAEKDKYDEAVTTGEQNPVAWPFPRPDWANAVDITPAQALAGYSCPDYGQLLITIVYNGSGGSIYVSVNNKNILYAYHPGGGVVNNRPNSVVCTVAKGDVMKFSSISNLDGQIISFVPWKQA